jgi:hypothetical protein
MSINSKSTYVQRSLTAEIWASSGGVRVLWTMKQDPGTRLRRIAAAEGADDPLVWRIRLEVSLYPYHNQRI